jgi:hypothetical protein
MGGGVVVAGLAEVEAELDVKDEMGGYHQFCCCCDEWG